jgi:hypothetical protein
MSRGRAHSHRRRRSAFGIGPRVRRASAVVGIALLVTSGLIGATVTESSAASTNLSQELFGTTNLFTGASQGGAWAIPATGQVVPAGHDVGAPIINGACLTAGTNPSPTSLVTPIPGCTTDITGDISPGSTTISNVSNTTGLAIGEIVAAQNDPTFSLIPPNDTIAALSANSITLQSAATTGSSVTAQALLVSTLPNGTTQTAVSFTADIPANNDPTPNVITLEPGESATGLAVGDVITDTVNLAFPANDTVTSINTVANPPQITLSQPSIYSFALPGESLEAYLLNNNADPNGAGVLQLTGSVAGAHALTGACSNASLPPCGNYLDGGVFLASGLPSTQGLNIAFNTYQYNTTSGNSAADGIGFTLAAGNPLDPTAPTALGPDGGSLGYSAQNSTAKGLPFGYLGFGLDVFGNFETQTYQGTNCSGGAASGRPESITVRGPGNEYSGYCELASTANTFNSSTNNLPTGPDLTSSGLLGGAGNASQYLDDAGTRIRPILNNSFAPQPVAVQILLNTSSSAIAAPSDDPSVDWSSLANIPADNWAIAVTPIEVYSGTATAKAGTTIVQHGALPLECPFMASALVKLVGTTNATTSVSTASDTTGVAVGDVVQGTDIPAGTTVTAVGANSLTLSNAATDSATVTMTISEPSTVSFAGTTNGSTSVSGITSTSGISVGMTVSGSDIPASTTVTAVATNSITLSNAATGSTSNEALIASAPVTQIITGTEHATATVDSIADTSNLLVGDLVEGSGIPADTSITAVSANSITLSNPATGSGAQTLYVTPTTIQASGALSSGSTAVTGLANTSGLTIGDAVTGTGIPANTTIAAIAATSVTLSQNATSSGTHDLTFSVPAQCANNGYGTPSAWVSPVTGLPYQLVLGWTASTGNSTESHEVNNFAASTANGTVPVLQIRNTDSLNGAYSHASGSTFNYVLTPSLAGGQGNEQDPPEVTDTIPAGVDLSGATVSAPNWSCQPITGSVGAGWNLTCDYRLATPITAPVDPSSSTPLGTITINNATVPAGTTLYTATAVVSSLDALSGQANDVLSSANEPTTTTVVGNPEPANFSTTVTYTATVKPTNYVAGTNVLPNPTGTVTFFDAGTPITGCTASATPDPTSLVGASTATCTVSGGYPIGTSSPRNITAVYSDNSNFYQGSQGQWNEDLGSKPTSTAVVPTGPGVSGSPPTTDPNLAVTYTATVTNTSGSGGPPTGTVSFVDTTSGLPGTAIAGCQNLSFTSTGALTGTVACTISAGYANGGAYQVTADFTGSGIFSDSSGLTPLDVDIPTTTAVVPSANPVPRNTTVTYTATVTNTTSTNGPPTGTVSFSDITGGSPGTAITGCQNLSFTSTGALTGTVACTVTGGYPTTGAYIIKASFVPTGTLFKASNGTTTEGVDAIPTSTAVVPAPNPTLINTTVVYTATVTNTSGTGGPPTGTVSFSDITGGSPGTAITGCQNLSFTSTGALTGTVACTVTGGYPHTGTYQVEADFTPTGLFLSSNGSGSDLVQSVAPTPPPVPTETSVVADPDPTGVSTPITYTATVVATTGGLAPVGTVSFTDGSSVISGCSAVILNAIVPQTSPPSSKAVCSTTADPTVGTFPIGANYPGAGQFLSSSGTTEETTLANNPTTTSVVGAPNPGPTNTTITYTATVVATSSSTAPTGAVDFTDAGSTIAGCATQPLSPSTPATMPPSSIATCVVTGGYPVAGSHPIGAQYLPTGTFHSSNGSTVEVINAKTILQDLKASATPATQFAAPGDTVMLSATGLPNDATGTVTFTSSGKQLCQGTVSNGHATCVTTGTLQIGEYDVTASYSGDNKYAPEDAPTTFTITPLSMTAKADPPITRAGNSVTLTASGLPGDATGTVKFTSDGSPLCTGPVSGGRATCPTPLSLKSGVYPVTALYSGDAHHEAATADTQFILTQPAIIIGTTPHDTPVDVDLPAGSSTGPFSCTITQGPPPSQGTWTLTNGCRLRFFPSPGFTGMAHFTYSVKDGRGVQTEANGAAINVGPPSSPVPVPGAHTGEPWSGWPYWTLVTLLGGSGLGLIWFADPTGRGTDTTAP